MQEASGASQAQSSHSESADPNQGGIDYNELFESQKQEIAAAKNQHQKLSQDFETLKGEASGMKDTINRMKSVFAPEESVEADPIDSRIDELNAEIDEALSVAIEAERAGHPIPRTTKVAISNLKFQIETLSKGKEKDKLIADLQAQVKQLANPANAIDQQAYSNIDSHLVGALETIYGPGEEMQDTKAAQFHAVATQIGDEIKMLKKQQPDVWERIRRDQTAQKKMVAYFVKQNMPPKARQLMEEDEIRRTPLTHNELMSAFNEARELLAKDPHNPQFQQNLTEIRREILGKMWDKNAGKSSRLRANDLF